MRVALMLLLVAVGTVLFHFLSPWWWTEIASNWGFIDTTIVITFWITGVVFVAVIAFMAWCAWKYRTRAGHKAHYEPESGKLELWLTVGTAVGVVALLTPGLFAWADYVTVPDDAAEVEIMGWQWNWAYRFPGADGVLGTTAVRHVSFDNPFGLNPDDPNGHDDVLVNSNELHLPLGQPTKLLLRSRDVLHNFYVPHFRAKMDMVPGMVTFMWFEPTRTGRFEVICAELCGEGHWNMRGFVVVEEEAAFDDWLSAQPTFADTREAVATAGEVDPLVVAGRDLVQSNGCLGCHSLDGTTGIGPSWQGLYGKTERLADGGTAVVDAAFIAESVREPNATVIEGYPPSMPPYQFSDEEVAAVVAFIESLAP